jgi:hypothetical protein
VNLDSTRNCTHRFSKEILSRSLSAQSRLHTAKRSKLQNAINNDDDDNWVSKVIGGLVVSKNAREKIPRRKTIAEKEKR